MRSLVVLLGAAVLCPLAGCGSSEDRAKHDEEEQKTLRLVQSYRSSLRRLEEGQQKILRILEGVKDRASMNEGLALLREYKKTAGPTEDLGEIPPAVKDRLQEEIERLREGGERVKQQFHRIHGLPEGEEFFKAVEDLKKIDGPKRP